jgi:serine-type D-Ala-D-Ala endopeptidase (penicillin-binding protein 7)
MLFSLPQAPLLKRTSRRLPGLGAFLAFAFALVALVAVPMQQAQAATAKPGASAPAKAQKKAVGKTASKTSTKAAAKGTKKSASKAAAKPSVKASGKASVKASVTATNKLTGKVTGPVRVVGKAGKAGKVQASSARGPGLRLVKRNGRKVWVRLAPPAPPPPTMGQLYGLHQTQDALDLRSSVALVIDQDTDEVLFSKNPKAVLPIASITKLMTALVVAEAALPMDEMLVVGPDDVQATIGSKSRLQLGTQLTRGEMLHLSLMASENRAAHVLGRSYPGGLTRFVSAMNNKAQTLGMGDTRYVEPTGLSSNNQSSAQDLARLVRAASQHSIIRELSTSLEMMVPMGDRSVQFRNTNGLVRNPEWDIGLQKTGFISAAGRCVVMQAQLAGRKLIMVLLDSTGKNSRIGDAERLRHWLADASLARGAVAAPVIR